LKLVNVAIARVQVQLALLVQKAQQKVMLEQKMESVATAGAQVQLAHLVQKVHHVGTSEA
jgi:hypothetical protein